MERTLTWEPGGLGSGATLVLTRCDLREVTLPLFSDLENQEAGHSDGSDPFGSLRLELSGPDSIQKRVMGETCHRRALLPPGGRGPGIIFHCSSVHYGWNSGKVGEDISRFSGRIPFSGPNESSAANWLRERQAALQLLYYFFWTSIWKSLDSHFVFSQWIPQDPLPACSRFLTITLTPPLFRSCPTEPSLSLQPLLGFSMGCFVCRTVRKAAPLRAELPPCSPFPAQGGPLIPLFHWAQPWLLLHQMSADWDPQQLCKAITMATSIPSVLLWRENGC